MMLMMLMICLTERENNWTLEVEEEQPNSEDKPVSGGQYPDNSGQSMKCLEEKPEEEHKMNQSNKILYMCGIGHVVYIIMQ